MKKILWELCRRVCVWKYTRIGRDGQYVKDSESNNSITRLEKLPAEWRREIAERRNKIAERSNEIIEEMDEDTQDA